MITLPTRLDLIKTLPDGAWLAEIGVRRAAFSNEILSHCRVGKMFLIDGWREYPGYHELSQEAHDVNYLETLRIVSNHSDRADVIREYSIPVAKYWAKFFKPLDAVYIDGNHTYEAATDDLVHWSRCLKPDGVLMGHDYIPSESQEAKRFTIQVVEAVNDFCKEHGWTITHLTQEKFASYRLERV